MVSVGELGDEMVGDGGAFADEIGGMSDVENFMDDGFDEGLVKADLYGFGGFINDDGGDGVFLVVDVKVEGGFSEGVIGEDGSEALAEILGDDDGAIIISTLFEGREGFGAVGENPLHVVVFAESVGDAVTEVDGLVGDGGVSVFVDDGDGDVFGVVVGAPVGIDI